MSPIPFVVLALCGLAFGAVRPVPRFGGRVAGGEPTTIEEHPYQLSVRSGNFHFCGASIIGPYHALTTANCAVASDSSVVGLHSGTSYLDQDGTRHQIISIALHPKHDATIFNIDYDYAIIEVSTPFPDHAVKLCTVEPSAGQTGVLTGWGALSSDHDLSNQLQVVNIPIMSRSACENKYSTSGFSVTQRTICTAMDTDGKGACFGDHGNPLIVNGKQCGVVSWGFGCSDGELPGLYANVADQLSWIQATARI